METRKRGQGRPFEAGNKLGGRKPVDPEIRRIFESATADAARAVVDLLGSPDGNLRLKAAHEIFDRVFGKPAQAVELGAAKEGGPASLVLRFIDKNKS